MVRQYERYVVAALAIVVALSSAGLAGASAFSGHFVPRSAASVGVVTIASDGSISPGTAPISQSGSTYTLTAQLDGSLVVNANGVTIDGAGYVINYTIGETGGDGAAVSVNGSSSVVVENIRSANASTGILANDAPGISIQGNHANGSAYDIEVRNTSTATVTGNQESGTAAANAAILVEFSSNVRLTSNVVNGASEGFWVWNSTGITIQDNYANATVSDGAMIQGSSNVAVDGNLFEGFAPAATDQYAVWIDHSNFVAADSNQANNSMYGFYAGASHDVKFVGDNASFSAEGFWLSNVGNGLVAQDDAYEVTSSGVGSQESSNVSFIGNDLAYDGVAISSSYDSGFSAISNYAPWASATAPAANVYYSTDVLLAQNNFSEARDEAVYLEETYNVSVTGNDLTHAAHEGIYVYETYGPTWVSGNNLSGTLSPSGTGIYVEYSYGPITVTDNEFYNVYYGLEAYEPYGAVVFDGNLGGGIGDSAIYVEYSYGPITAANNQFDGVYYFLYDYYDYAGSTTVVDNVVNQAYSLVYSDEYGAGTTPIVVSGNVAPNATYGVYLYEEKGSIAITNNQFLNSSEAAISVYDAFYGAVIVSGNNVDGANYIGIEVYNGENVTISDNSAARSGFLAIEAYTIVGGLSVIGNDATHSLGTALEIEDVTAGGAVISGNRAGGSNEALFLDASTYQTWVQDNDFSGTNYSYVYAAILSVFSGNDFLGESNTSFAGDTLGVLDHNDFNSSAFYQTGTILEGSGWNSPYPVGGNYWTGYTGADLKSGPGQNLSGADGIGDTPYSIGGATDQYPLVDAWFGATITFQEGGLPSTSTWSVTLNGHSESAAAGQSISFAQSNGANTAYTYTVASSQVNYTAAPASGSGTEDGVSHTVSVTFALNASTTLFAVTFNESGLPAGLAWSVTLNGVTETTTGSSITFHEKSGNYTYSISVPSGYSVATSSGTVTVSGAPALVAVKVSGPNGGPSSTTSSSLNNPLSLGLLAALIAAILAALIGWILYVRSRKAGGSSAAPPPWQETPPQPPSTPPA